jgi:hypothetical protein
MRRAFVLLVLVPGVAHATDPFEIQVYDGTANAPGAFGLELHANSVFRGSREAPPTGELAQNRATHFTFEPSVGLTKWWELGAYLQTALLPDGTFYYAGVKLRSKFVTPPTFHKHLRLGANFEVSLLPTHFDRNEWAGELRPIVAWENEQFAFALNPIIDVAFAGPDYSDGPTFQPAAMALYKWEDRVSLGFEYYANYGPFTDLLPLSKEEQYVFEVVNVLAVKHFELNIGFGEGLTPASNPFVAKTILGYTWEKEDKKVASMHPLRFLTR